MSKPLLLFRAPVKTMSGYGARSRDILKSLREIDLFDIKIDNTPWGSTPMTALDLNDEHHKWIINNIVTRIDKKPDVFIQVTIPSEFTPIGTHNIGITAGVETTVAPKEWIDGCNRMDLILTSSKFSRDVLYTTIYNETDNNTGKLRKQYRVEKPIEVLFEGIDTKTYKEQNTSSFDLSMVEEDFAFLFVGHWLNGIIGQDRKDVGGLIQTFIKTFENYEKKPALILKTSKSGTSVRDREILRELIESLNKSGKNAPSIYLIHGELSDKEMNELYNHPKIKSMVSLTKGEGFGRPLLEFSMTGKPIIASNWSGQKDFLSPVHTLLVGGELTNVHKSASDKILLKESKWFTANYDEASRLMEACFEQYDQVLKTCKPMGKINSEHFSIKKMTIELKKILKPISNLPTEHEFKLPELIKKQ